MDFYFLKKRGIKNLYPKLEGSATQHLQAEKDASPS